MNEKKAKSSFAQSANCQYCNFFVDDDMNMLRDCEVEAKFWKLDVPMNLQSEFFSSSKERHWFLLNCKENSLVLVI